MSILTLVHNFLKKLIHCTILVKFNRFILLIIICKFLMLFQYLNFAFVIFLYNRQTSFLNLNILNCLLLICNILNPLCSIILLQINLFTHLDIFGEESHHDQDDRDLDKAIITFHLNQSLLQIFDISQIFHAICDLKIVFNAADFDGFIV